MSTLMMLDRKKRCSTCKFYNIDLMGFVVSLGYEHVTGISKALLTHLVSYMKENSTDISFSMHYLSKAMLFSESTIKQALKDLVNKKMLSVIKSPSHSYEQHVYRVNERMIKKLSWDSLLPDNEEHLQHNPYSNSADYNLFRSLEQIYTPEKEGSIH